MLDFSVIKKRDTGERAIMKFATLGHLDNEHLILNQIPKNWIKKNMILSPEYDLKISKGYFLAIKYTAKELMDLPREEIRQNILDVVTFAQDNLNVELVQLGALTTSVTDGGIWLSKQKDYSGYINHGDSYTAAITCDTVDKAIRLFKKKYSDLTISIVGAYGIIGEAVSKILVPKFKNSILIGRRKEKLNQLEKKIKGNFKTTVSMETKKSDIIITATSHPTALLRSEDLKKNAIIIDVSQPTNLSYDICLERKDINRFDGGYVDFPYNLPIPYVPKGKLFSCIVEAIMQAAENEKKNYVGSIDMKHLQKTKIWGKKYGFVLNELTNFGKPVKIGR